MSWSRGWRTSSLLALAWQVFAQLFFFSSSSSFFYVLDEAGEDSRCENI